MSLTGAAPKINIVKTVVLDTNELTRNYMLTGLKYQLIETMGHTTWLDFRIPRVVLEELIANHERAVTAAKTKLDKLNRERRMLGLAGLAEPADSLDYRAYVEERLDERLGISVLEWPITAHSDLVARAVRRRRPFNERGDGYRDALVWADVARLAGAGQDVALVSADRAFAGPDGALAAQLAAEVAELPGSVELVSNFGQWLIKELPWHKIADLESAIQQAASSQFVDYYLHSDFQEDLAPDIQALGFSAPPYSVVIDEVQWDGSLTNLGGSTDQGDGGLLEFELGQEVSFYGVFPVEIQAEEGWSVSEPDLLHRVEVEGVVDMTLRVAVLFGGEFGLVVDELSWLRADGTAPGPSTRDLLDPRQMRFPEMG